MRWLRSLLGTPTALRATALASIAANVGIVITGGAVRLTGSGLGCPTWPRCTEDSYVATDAMGINGAIEFGNRTLTLAVGVVAALALGSALLQRPRRPRTVPLATAVLAGIPAQAVVGGITVLTDLNPWVVGCHFLVSMLVLAGAHALWRAAGGGRQPARVTASAARALRGLGAATVATAAVVLVLGTAVTGSGPHAGDADARRNGLNPEVISQLHADSVFVLVGIVIGLAFALRATGVPARPAVVLLAVVLAQGLIGFVQYFSDLPAVLVAAHMAGACAVWLAALGAVRATLPTAPPPAAPAVAALSPEPAGDLGIRLCL